VFGRAWRILAGLPWALVAAAVITLPRLVHAQAGTELSGRVTRDGGPASHAVIQVTAAAGETVRVLADSAGRYRVRLPADGPYVVSVSSDGVKGESRYLPAVEAGAPVQRTADFQLTEPVSVLEPVLVRAQPLSVAASTRHEPGSREQARLAVTMRDEPLTSDLLGDVAAREPGVAVSVDGTGLSISGQPADQSRLTLDGSDAMSIAVPREAVRAVNLLTSTYDVARGRFTGGQLDVQTLRGGNEWGGTARIVTSGSSLEYGGSPGLLAGRSSHLSIDAGGGGALVADRLFTYSAVSARRSVSRAPWLTDLDAVALRRLGLNPDSIARFLDLTAEASPASSNAGPAVSQSVSGLSRLDAVLAPRQSLMLRVAGQRSSISDPERALTLPGTGTDLHQGAVGALAQLSSGGRRMANELRLNLGLSAGGGDPSDPVPAGILLSEPAGDPNQLGATALRFAGSPLAPPETRDRTWEIADQVIAQTADEHHRFRLGAELAGQEYERAGVTDGGTFVYETLDELSANRPTLYTRSLFAEPVHVRGGRAAVFMDDRWTPGNLQLSYGVRAERAWISGSERDLTVEEYFGEGRGRVPSPWRLSPRIGFGLTTRMPWDRGPNGRTSISGGLGHFVGGASLPAMAGALAETGRPEAADLVCVGTAAPVPQWAKYRSDSASIPDECTDGAPALSTRLSRATLFAPGFSPPVVWRGSLGGQGVLEGGIIWNISAALLLGVRQPLAFDRNLRPEPQFLNEAEARRQIYVRPEDIDQATGLPPLAASRLHPDLGVVRELTSLGRSRTLQLSASASQVFFTRRLGWVQADLGYTWTHGRERTGGIPALGGAFATTGGDPRHVQWTAAGYSPRHIIQGYAVVSPSSRLWAGLIATVSSGRPFTPMVAGDANGDGLQNDRAFVFDPETAPDAAIASGMGRLLRELPGGARRCLRAQLGSVAAPSSCSTGWSMAMDLNLRYSFGPRIESTPSRRATLWFVASNVPSALDYMLHGSDDLRGWGQPAAVDPVLLSVRGFDPAAQQFRYEVNPGFGRPGDASLLSRLPFSVSLQMRLVIGTDRALRDFRNRMAAGQVNASAFTPANIRLHASRQLPNVPAEILALNVQARLLLTPSQAQQLEQAASSLAPRIETLVSEVVSGVARVPAPAALTAQRAGELVREAGALRMEGVRAAESILTPEQWDRVPARLRDVESRFSPHPSEEFSGIPDH
jgi:hypothetical protein